MTEPKLSVIIPFYDESSYLKTALKSVFAQDIENLEIIVVNDNPDAFSKTAFEFFGVPANVCLVHHKKNAGLSAARNTGLKKATGTHIAFLDADDYYLHNGLKDQWAYALKTEADITHAQCLRSPVGTPDAAVLPRDRLMFDDMLLKGDLSDYPQAQFFTSCWSSIYKRSFLEKNHIRFDEEQRKFEDRLFVLQTVSAARSIATLGQPVRVWRGRYGSISVAEPDHDTRIMQLQLLEKCTDHIQHQVATGRLNKVFETREAFNTISRLIWDLDFIETIATNKTNETQKLAVRVQRHP